MRADVKSERYEVSDSPPESVQFQPLLAAEDGGDEEAAIVPWWELFPRRWVIVLLCFSAFLLCNMDRVSMHRLLLDNGVSVVNQLLSE